MLIIPLVIDFIWPDPQTKWHPIALIGRWIGWWEKRLYKADSRLAGLVLWLIVVLSLILLVQPLRWLPPLTQQLVKAVLAVFLFSGRSLVTAGRTIGRSLSQEPIETTRRRLSWIVGRDTDRLDRAAIVRATVETVAENTVDGLIAPACYYFLGSLFGYGLEGALVYKAVNTMDSMLGYKNARYGQFGYYPARLDDAFNYLPARLGAWLMLLAAGLAGFPLMRAWRVFRADRTAHASPNAGWPESVVAGALGLRLGGANFYGGQRVEKPSLGRDEGPVDVGQIEQANRILQVSHSLLIGLAIIVQLAGGQI